MTSLDLAIFLCLLGMASIIACVVPTVYRSIVLPMPHHGQPHFNLKEYIMSLSARASELANEIRALPALIKAGEGDGGAAAVAAVQAQATEDLDGIAAAVADATPVPAAVEVPADVPVSDVPATDPTAPTGA